MQDKLDSALSEIRRLYGATSKTAEAVAAAIPRAEAEDRAKSRTQDLMKTVIIATAAHFVLMLVLFWVFSSRIGERITEPMEREHAILECLSTTEVETKVANPRAAVTACLTRLDN